MFIKRWIIKLVFILLIIGIASAQASPTPNYVDQGNTYAKSGHYQEALNMLNTALTQNNRDARAYKIRGHVYYAMGDYSRAFTDLDYVVALVPDSANAYADRAIIHSVLGRHGMALADIERALALKPSSTFAKNVREKILERASGK